MTPLRRKAVIFAATLSLCGGFLLSAPPASAQILPSIVPECAKVKDKNANAPSLNCALQTFGNIANVILGVSGSFALLMFVYGGFLFLSSAGNQEQVSKGKTVLKNAIMGIVIILGSGYVITYGLDQLGVRSTTENPILGAACPDGGVSVSLKGGAVACIKTCSDKKLNEGLSANDAYKCRAISQGVNCISGILCTETGQACCQLATAAPEARPTAPQAPSSCQLRHVGFDCVNINTRLGGGRGCFSNLCPGESNVLCCPPAGLDTRCTDAHPGYSCRNKTTRPQCFTGLCPGSSSNQCCN
ncbi:MAG: pilin [Patescibacteria group bacterium]